jgi:putative transcriptional regulator
MSVLAPGLLVAAPPLGDPNFDQSVVLLAAHGEDGAFGWIINGPEVMSIGELLVRADITSESLNVGGVVRVGGPVSPEQVWLVYPAQHRFEHIEGQFDVGPNIVASASRRILEAIAATKTPEGLFAIVGYAGWAPSQLEDEIRAGAWLPTDVVPSLVFGEPREGTWQRAYEQIGASPISFTSRTVGSA